MNRTDTELIADLTERLSAPSDWVDAFVVGDIITTAEAGQIAGCSSETARRRCVEADEEGQPLGVLVAQAVWFISTRRWLDDIEQREGKHARLVAESKTKKVAEMRLPPQLGTRSLAF